MAEPGRPALSWNRAGLAQSRGNTGFHLPHGGLTGAIRILAEGAAYCAQRVRVDP